MARGRAAIAAIVVAVAMALAGGGLSHTGQTKATQAVAIHAPDNEQPGNEMSSF